MAHQPLPSVKEETVQSATMEQLCKVSREAFEKVASNRGAAGPDGESIEEVRKHLPEQLPKLKEALSPRNESSSEWGLVSLAEEWGRHNPPSSPQRRRKPSRDSNRP